ncbi:hypothetical protein PR048_004579 [Dryococelus australis]|uniref:CCHC-type domain-containing protein n=1 Tax=Dryococelus australis TaxID=614101 RepID=A0ABQ9I6X5_9NEOP|nr:hypothetical protein PR048_004579 [Dryococelus australis]
MASCSSQRVLPASCSSQRVLPILLDNSGFGNWKFGVKLVLDKKKDKEKKEFLKKDTKAKSVIVQCLPDKYLDLVKDARRAKDMLKSLEEVFESKSVFSTLYLNKKLLALKFKPKEKLEEHFLRFDGLVCDLENAGAKMDDTDKICHLLLTMGDNFNTVITAIETMKQDLTMEFVKCRLLEEEMKREGKMCQETPSSNEVSFKITCYGCGKVGHKRRECWHNKQRTGKTKGTERKPFKRNETPGGPRAHQADISFTTFSCKVMSKNNIFILDSGATNHLVVGSLEEYMSEIRTLPHSVVIKTANGGKMIATRAGKFMGNYDSETISFEALIVLGLKINLSEFGKIITTSETSLWHRRLGHLNRRGLQVLTLPFSEEKCPQCLENKVKKSPFKKNEKSTQSIGEFLHSDISRPVKTVTKEGEQYFQNSKADRMNLTLMNKVRTKFAETDQPCTLWGEAVRASAYKLNRSPTSSLQNRTPASVWFGENDLSKLRSSEESDKESIGFEAPDKEKNKRSKPNRTIKKPSHLQEYELYMAYCLCAGEPQDYEYATKLGNGWYEAIESEIKALELHQTWPPTVLFPREKAIETKWIFKTKKDGLKKARLVAKGFQEESANNVYAPVARLPTTPFLNGYVDNDIYIKTPDGVKNEPSKVLKLKRSLYGMRSAPRKWNERFHNFMETRGMTRSASDFCLYIGENVWLIIWVDDMLVTGERTQVENLIRLLKGEFKANDLGILSEFLGTTMIVNYGGEVKISQSSFINNILSKFNMILCKGVNTPMVCDFQVDTDEPVNEKFMFRQLSGSLMYVATVSRLDISYSVC